MQHVTVLLEEAVNALNLSENSIVVDATLGAGGHSRLITKFLGKQGRLIALDVDSKAINTALDIAENSEAKVDLVNDNFVNLEKALEDLAVTEVDAILADLGWRLDQFTEEGRGFSFKDEKDLLMTYGNEADYTFTAKDIVNTWEEASIADIIYGYGEERFARRIAKAIVAEREVKEFATAAELAECIKNALPKKVSFGKTHPATKSFQALRIAVNDELGSLESFLETAFRYLKPNGRLAIITFHSLEDRVVKHRFREWVQSGNAQLVFKKPLLPTAEEIKNNPRARSAKMRVLEKLPN